MAAVGGLPFLSIRARLVLSFILVAASVAPDDPSLLELTSAFACGGAAGCGAA